MDFLLRENSEKLKSEVRKQKKYFTSEEVCLYTGIKPKTLDRFAHLNKISYFKRGRRRYFEITEVDRFMQAGLIPARDQDGELSNAEREGGKHV